MNHKHYTQRFFYLFLLLLAFVFVPGTLADYERANGLREKYEWLAVNIPVPN